MRLIERFTPADYASLEDFYVEWTKYEAEYKLNRSSKSFKNTKIDEYILTAVSESQVTFTLSPSVVAVTL